MRSSPVPLALLAAACSSTGSVSDERASRCETASCFDQTEIRDFEVVDDTTLVVYVGAQNCPFRVELIGTFCDVTFLPGDPVFRPTRQREAREPRSVPSPLPDFNRRADVFTARVCANDMSLGLDQGPFAAGGIEDPSGLDCRVRDVASLTDDELLELYVDKRVAPPPPPVGAGAIEVEESEPGESDDADADADADSAAETPSGE